MLNFALKGTYQDSSGYSWDYYRDDQVDSKDPNKFYIVPKPAFMIQEGTDKPVFSIIKNVTDGSDNGSGTCQFSVELLVPQTIQTAISAAILSNTTQFPGVITPTFVTLQWNAGGSVSFSLVTEGIPTYFTVPVSGFGGSVANFLLALTSKQLSTLISLFSVSGGASSLAISYNVSVPARMIGVAAVLTFDSSIAYQYQITQPTYNSWGDQTSPGSVQSYLQSSESSTVTLNWGITKPPQLLVTSVTSWANNTIADLVNAEVKKEMALLNMQSGSSFDISEVSNFSANFNENMVIDWIITPQATLPSFPGMGLNISNFIQEVNLQQQVMAVSTNLPFTGTPASLVSSLFGGSVQPLVENVVVKVTYPGLPEANDTFTFTNNSSHTFNTVYNTTQGPVWSLQYTVNFQDKTLPAVNATIANISSAEYVLSLTDAGILTVNFDATDVFSLGQNIPEKIEIDLSFVNIGEAGIGSEPFTQKITLSKDLLKGNITSMQVIPITSAYNYQVTYFYTVGVPFPAPKMQNQTGFTQTITQAAGQHEVNAIMVWLAAEAGADQLLSGTISLWYDTPPDLPSWYNIASLPTKANPTDFNLTIAQDSKGNSIGKNVFYGLTTNNQPLYYTATLTPMVANEIIIESQMIQNTVNTIKASPTQRYFTLVADAKALDWSLNPYSQIQLQVTFTIAQGTSLDPVPTAQSTQVMELFYNKNEIDSQYLTLAIQLGNTVTYDCIVTYITTGKPAVKNNQLTLTELVFTIPPTPAH